MRLGLGRLRDTHHVFLLATNPSTKARSCPRVWHSDRLNRQWRFVSTAGVVPGAPPATISRIQASYFLANQHLGNHGSSSRASSGGGGGIGDYKSASSLGNSNRLSGFDGTATKPTVAVTAVTSENASTTTTATDHLSSPESLPPHRRRLAAKRAAAAASSSADPPPLPPDASSVLTTLAARQPARSWGRYASALLSLSKPRLTVLVVLTAMAPYALYPVPAFLSPTALLADAPSLSPLTLLFLTTGTALCSAAANALNMLYERATDGLMSRTRNRPLVRRLVSAPAAAAFAVAAAAVGLAALYFGVNATVAFLGGANIVLYAAVYTPLKAVTAANTWVGAAVGAIPPLMGWAAAAGESATGDGSWRELLMAGDGSSLGGWLLAALLFCWQFPHFMALSWPIRDEYRAAGLRMLAWTNPARNGRVALRYGAFAFLPLCVALCASGVTEWSFAATSLPVNAWLGWQAVRFWRLRGFHGSARGLFWPSVWHVPVVMALALLQKKGMWSRVWRSLFPDDDSDDDLDRDADEADPAEGLSPHPRRPPSSEQACSSTIDTTDDGCSSLRPCSALGQVDNLLP